jgi:hypothetical protein
VPLYQKASQHGWIHREKWDKTCSSIENTIRFPYLRATFQIYDPLFKNTIHFSHLSTNLSKNLWVKIGGASPPSAV